MKLGRALLPCILFSGVASAASVPQPADCSPTKRVEGKNYCILATTEGIEGSGTNGGGTSNGTDADAFAAIYCPSQLADYSYRPAPLRDGDRIDLYDLGAGAVKSFGAVNGKGPSYFTWLACSM